MRLKPSQRLRISKYRAVRTKRNGIEYHSKGEADRHAALQLLEKAGKISDLRTQVPFTLQDKFRDSDGKAVRAIAYIMDFTYTENGKLVAEDFKGFQTPDNSIKQKLFKKRYPEWILRITKG